MFGPAVEALAQPVRVQHGGPDATVTDGEAALERALLRADLTAVETYPSITKTVLPCPVVALGGAADPRVTYAELQAWQALTQASFAMHTFPGGHFYLNEQIQPLLSTIAGHLA